MPPAPLCSLLEVETPCPCCGSRDALVVLRQRHRTAQLWCLECQRPLRELRRPTFADRRRRMELTPHQQEAITWLVDKLTSGTTLVSLTGYAGSGKTTLIPALRDALQAKGFQVAIGAPTHRAAMVLRSKGLVDAETVHSLALTPSFTPDYVRAVTWLGGKATARPTVDDVLHDDIEGVPFLVAQACTAPIALNAQALRSRNKQFSAQRLLDSLGIRGQDFFREFLPREANGCLILDEASMVDAALLQKCQEAFPCVCLVGDPGQLPPVEGPSVLADVDGFTLTEIHRQAQDSPIVQLATLAREGEPFWRIPLPAGEALERGHAADASRFLTCPLLVYRNFTRVACTQRIRAALGYPPHALVPGEPLVCRSTEASDRAMGFYNNALFKVISVHPEEPRLLTVADETGHEVVTYAHLEELDGDKKDPRAVWFRFGYVLTAHTAQGGEWPTVYISQLELLWYHQRCVREHEEPDHRRWAYTAITRAKSSLVFLMQHTFTPPESEDVMAEKIAPPSAPFLTETPPIPAPEPDDIPDPVTPDAVLAAVAPLPASFGEHEALLQGFAQHLQAIMHRWMLEEHHTLASGMDATLTGIRDWAKTVFASNEHASYQLSDALLKIQEGGLTLRGEPYKLRVQVVSSQGFPVTIEVMKPDAEQLIAGLEGLLTWLAEAGFHSGRRAAVPVAVGRADDDDDEIPF